MVRVDLDRDLRPRLAPCAVRSEDVGRGLGGEDLQAPLRGLITEARAKVHPFRVLDLPRQRGGLARSDAGGGGAERADDGRRPARHVHRDRGLGGASGVGGSQGVGRRPLREHLDLARGGPGSEPLVEDDAGRALGGPGQGHRVAPGDRLRARGEAGDAGGAASDHRDRHLARLGGAVAASSDEPIRRRRVRLYLDRPARGHPTRLGGDLGPVRVEGAPQEPRPLPRHEAPGLGVEAQHPRRAGHGDRGLGREPRAVGHGQHVGGGDEGPVGGEPHRGPDPHGSTTTPGTRNASHARVTVSPGLTRLGLTVKEATRGIASSSPVHAKRLEARATRREARPGKRSSKDGGEPASGPRASGASRGRFAHLTASAGYPRGPSLSMRTSADPLGTDVANRGRNTRRPSRRVDPGSGAACISEGQFSRPSSHPLRRQRAWLARSAFYS